MAPSVLARTVASTARAFSSGNVRVACEIVSVRRYRTLRLEDVARLTRSLDKVRPFITTLDWTPGGLTDAADLRARVAPVAEPQQLSLF